MDSVSLGGRQLQETLSPGLEAESGRRQSLSGATVQTSILQHWHLGTSGLVKSLVFSHHRCYREACTKPPRSRQEILFIRFKCLFPETSGRGQS